jgi:phosphotransferase system  glucose/maltose/N-acetylglucosamine-specific IIC component
VLWSISTDTPLATFFFAVAIAAAGAAFFYARGSKGDDKDKSKAKKGSSILTAIFAGISAWTGVMFVYGLLFVQILRMT